MRKGGFELGEGFADHHGEHEFSGGRLDECRVAGGEVLRLKGDDEQLRAVEQRGDRLGADDAG